MAIEKNKAKYRKDTKKKAYDCMSRKEWYRLKAPAPFDAKEFGYTPANRTQGLKNIEDAIKGRVVTCVQPDLVENQEGSLTWRKIKLIVDNTEGDAALTSFYGIDMTRDELCSLVKKRRTLIEAVQKCKTKDGYSLRVFVIAFTKNSFHTQKKRTNYAQASQQKIIRAKINKLVQERVSKMTVTNLLRHFTSELLETEIVEKCSDIYPLENVKVRKIKVIQRPKIDAEKLKEMHEPKERDLKNRDLKKGTKNRGGASANLVHGDPKKPAVEEPSAPIVEEKS